MRLLYGRHFEARYAAIAAEVSDGASVVDVCCGDCYLYLAYLRHKSVRYLGLDLSPQLVQWARRRQVEARQFNVWQDELAHGDVVIMQASLYQFLPQAKWVVNQLLSAARQKVIITEPIRNVSSSGNPWIATVGHRLTVPGGADAAYSGQRFDRKSLTELFESFETFERSWLIPGGREMVGVFRGQGDA